MLSSRWTYFIKYIVAPFWILCFGVVALTVALAPGGGLADGRATPPPPGMQWLFVFIWIVASIGILRFTFPIKRVELRGDRLFVSNYFREWEIFPSDIESVRQNRWVNARPIRVRLRREIDGVGSSFAFIPPQRAMLRFWREDPQVEQLRRFAEAAARGKAA
jgi:hypothetical protein